LQFFASKIQERPTGNLNFLSEKSNNQNTHNTLDKIKIQIIGIKPSWQPKKEFDFLFYILYQFLALPTCRYTSSLKYK